MIYPMSCQVALGSFDPWARQEQEPVLLAPISLFWSQVQLSLGAHAELPQPAALGLVGHTLGWDPLPKLLMLLARRECV